LPLLWKTSLSQPSKRNNKIHERFRIQELIRTKGIAPLAYEEISQELIKLLLYSSKKR